MKNIFSLIILLAGIGFFYACEDNDNIVLQQPESFVLNTPKYASGIYDLQHTETIEFTTSQPDYGFTAATLYAVEISLSQNFAEYATLAGSYSTAKFDISAQDVAVALVALHEVEEESNYPVDPHPLYVRLSATISGSKVSPVYSNVITLPQVLGYFALEAMTMPEEMYIIGNVAGNWDWNSSTEMIPVWGSPGKFWAMQYLGQTGDGGNAEIKFNYAKEWNGNEFGYNDVTIGEGSDGISGNDDNNITIGNPGWYIVVVTTAIEGRGYTFSVDFLPPYVYLQGDVNGGHWGTTDEAYRFAIPDLSLGADAEFVSPAFTAATAADGGIRASIQLPGHEWWHTEFMVFDGVFIPRGAGGDQDRVAGTVGQRLSINFTNRTGNIE
ncbi:MAG: SusF/SusE family outer membrane protein [Proteiniphilum sp.]|uniref:SusF/SusE family outer membrane protein n=1 Tax=Proteiniphilum sp. TaxID=1926877 RepID=UPI002AB9E512|nr:SusF/SusE family outer membrane protein [Proteiniphilum sp.]MDY9918146.1 SusF/SusE family outer membrane protein [Proteiniphilum sp.]